MKKKYSRPESLPRMSLEALLRLQKAHAAFTLDYEKYQKELSINIAKENAYRSNQLAAKKEYEENFNKLDEELAPVKQKVDSLKLSLENYSIGFIGKLFLNSNDYLEWQGRKYSTTSLEIISKIESLNKHIEDTRKAFSEARPRFDSVKSDYLRCPTSDILIRDGTNSYKFDGATISADYLKDIIEYKNKELLLKNVKLEKLKAKASAYDEAARESAKALRKKNINQLATHPYCPYCNTPLSDTDVPHYDHIYPIARGGLSTTCNMVFVCSSCNQKKRDNTLREFINKYKLDESRIYAVLDLLGKRF